MLCRQRQGFGVCMLGALPCSQSPVLVSFSREEEQASGVLIVSTLSTNLWDLCHHGTFHSHHAIFKQLPLDSLTEFSTGR